MNLSQYTVYCRASRVFTIIPTMDTATNDIEVTETNCAAVLLSECSIRSHRNFWWPENFPVPKSSSASWILIIGENIFVMNFLQFEVLQLLSPFLPSHFLFFHNIFHCKKNDKFQYILNENLLTCNIHPSNFHQSSNTQDLFWKCNHWIKHIIINDNLLESKDAHFICNMKFSSSVEIENCVEWSRMSIKEVFIVHQWIVITELHDFFMSFGLEVWIRCLGISI